MSDHKLLERIAALLLHAEGAATEEEAAAYTEKAQKLATNAAIDIEVARRAQAKKDEKSPLIQRHIVIGPAGKKGLSRYVDLMLAIGGQNDVKFTISQKSTFVNAYGFAADIDVVEALYASLLVQMVTASDTYVREGSYKDEVTETYDWKTGEYKVKHTDGRVARASFESAFINRISYRISVARSEAIAERKKLDEDIAMQLYTDITPEQVEEARAKAASSGTELVLKEKAVEVHDFFSAKTKHLRGSYKGGRSSGYSANASRAGAAAGNSARIGAQGAIGGGRKAL